MPLIYRITLVLLLALGTTTVSAERHAWLVGGGPNLGDSQVSIELNTIWILDVIKPLSPQSQWHIYYTNGNGPEKDIKIWNKPSDDSLMEPLARVFGYDYQNGVQYRKNNVPGIIGDTSADNLQHSLTRDFAQLKDGDDVLFIYQGHGGHDGDRGINNHLRLWRDSKLTVTQIEQLFSEIPASVPVRFVFPQCFSGSFVRLMYEGADPDNGLATGTRCGFLAQSPDRESEGCTASVDTADYRDYSTYFFAALDGKTRTGEPLEHNPDLNHDNRITLREAHLYTLLTAESMDLSRATSEIYLEEWQPWYLRWFDTLSESDNEYAQLASHLARKNSLADSSSILPGQVSTKMKQLMADLENLSNKRIAAKEKITDLRQILRQRVMQQWPESDLPYTDQYARFITEHAKAAHDFIMQQSDYPSLVAQQDLLAALDQQELDTERALMQMKKITRFQKLGRIQRQFFHHASEREKAEYANLIQCEDSPP